MAIAEYRNQDRFYHLILTDDNFTYLTLYFSVTLSEGINGSGI
jgi:hypothetical protein